MKSKEICREKELCSGCAACANTCKHNAIIMKPDWRGFLYPHIDKDLCLDCGLCQKVCPINNEYKSFEYTNGYAFVENNKELLRRASSGGAFGVIARYVINHGGVVYGASMNNQYDIDYISVETIDDLQLLHGSKYVQSNVGFIYRHVKNSLNSNRWVLFCGCPCQVNGLNHYLNKQHERLITMDLICHGVPSQPYFKDYVKDLLREKTKQGIKAFRFRYKSETTFETQLEENKNSILIGYQSKDFYMTHFLWGKGYRSSCYKCICNGAKRCGDFTIGDFWNNKIAQLPINDCNGASLIICNTEKAKLLLDEFRNNGIVASIPSLELAIGKDGGNLVHPSKNDLRTNLLYALWRVFGVVGPKILFAIERKLMHI